MRIIYNLCYGILLTFLSLPSIFIYDGIALMGLDSDFLGLGLIFIALILVLAFVDVQAGNIERKIAIALDRTSFLLDSDKLKTTNRLKTIISILALLVWGLIGGVFASKFNGKFQFGFYITSILVLLLPLINFIPKPPCNPNRGPEQDK